MSKNNNQIKYKKKVGDCMANGMLTIKQKEAKEACDKAITSFTNLNTQINVTHNDGYKPLEANTSTVLTNTNEMLASAKDMNDLPKE